MPPLGRILKLVAGAIAGVVYVWIAAVRAVPRVHRRKRARGVGSRARRRAAKT